MAKAAFKKLPGSKIALEVTLDAAEFKAYYDAALDRALENVELKGFRKGTAPRELAEAAVDKDKVFHAATEEAVRRTLHDEGEENKWLVIDAPKIEVTEASPTGKVGLKYKAELTVFPEVKLGDYKKIACSVFSEKKEVTVPPEEVEKSLAWLRESRATLVRVNREARPGDLLDVDFEGFVDGKALSDLRGNGERFVLGESKFLPDFDRGLERRKGGESFRFSVAVPANFWRKDLEGKTVEISGTVNAVFERSVPVADDAFARGLGPHFKTIGEARKSIEEGLRKEKETKERERRRIKAIDEIIAASAMDIPDVMAEKTLDRMVAEAESLLRESGKTAAEIRAALGERARKSVAAHLVIHRIAEAEGLAPTSDEVHAEIVRQRLDPERDYDYSYGILQQEKVFRFIESQANG